MSKISTSILGINNKEKFGDLIKANPDYIHVDVMDGEFVSNYKDDYEKYITDKVLNIDIHLMVKNPINYIDKYKKYNPCYITIHIELDNINNYIDYIKKNNSKVGIAINPETKIEDVYPLLPFIDLVLIMSVHPGYGGQQFIEETYNKISTLRKYIDKNSYKTIISVDGGINDTNYKNVINNGADIIVVGNYITENSDINGCIKKMRE